MNARAFAKLTSRKLNQCDPLNNEAKYEIVKELLGTCSKGVYIEPPFYCDYGANIHLGENVYMNFNCTILDVAEVKIGKGTMFAPS